MKHECQTAEDIFLSGANCAQAVFVSRCSRYGISREAGMKLCSALGGGIAGTGNTCGAVTGALLIIGLQEGAGEVSEGFNDRAKERAGAFLRRFHELHGAIACRELLGYNMGIPGEKQLISDLELTTKRCPGIVASAAEILDEMAGPA
jgi:C_GCAxxG_C_C family probable redox protein